MREEGVLQVSLDAAPPGEDARCGGRAPARTTRAPSCENAKRAAPTSLIGLPRSAETAPAVRRSRVSSLSEFKKPSAGTNRLPTHVWSASTWMNPTRTPIPEARRRAVVDRDAAIARVRRATTATLALATALVAAFAGLAATSTHARKARRPKAEGSTATAIVQTPSVSPPQLESSGSSAPPPAPPAQAPTPSFSPPTAVSGGT